MGKLQALNQLQPASTQVEAIHYQQKLQAGR